MLSKIERELSGRAREGSPRSGASPWTHVLWFLDGCVLFFLISWVGTDVLTLDNDFYYAVFIWTTLTFLHAYLRLTQSNILNWFRARWRLSLFLGLLASMYVVSDVWAAKPTARPTGWLLVFELAWRGVAYGVVQALALSAFPVAVALGIFQNHVVGLTRRVGFGALTLLLFAVVSTAYNVGFGQFEGHPSEVQLGPVAVAVPAAVSINPLGSIVAQTTLHLAGTYRTFESDVYVPPAVDFVPDYHPPGVFGPR